MVLQRGDIIAVDGSVTVQIPKYDDGQIETAARTAFDALAADLAGKRGTLAGLGLLPDTAGEVGRGV